ncbi:MAG: MFS transporter [Chthoniobacteraceae bacterium]
MNAIQSPKPILPKKLWTVGTLTYTTAGILTLFCWLLWGDFVWSIKERAAPPLMQILFKSHGAPDTLVGFLIGSVPSVIGMILGPVISYKSDRHRGRWGRRIPYLFAPTPVAVISMVGLAYCPQIAAVFHAMLGSYSPGLNSTILILYSILWTLFAGASTIVNAVFGGLINDVVPESMLGRFFGAFRAISLVAGILFSYWMMGKIESHSLVIFLGLGLLYGIAFSVMCLKVKEGEYPPPPVAEENALTGVFGATKTYFLESFGNGYYCWFFVSFALSLMALVPVNLFNVYFAQSVGMSMDTFGKLMAVAFLLSLIAAYPLGVLVDRFHPLQVSLVTLVIYTGVSLWGGFFSHNSLTLGIVLVPQCFLAGVWLTATASLQQRLFPKNRFAQFSSAAGIVSSLGCIIISPIMGSILDYTGHTYRHIFLVSSVLSFAALLTGLIVYRRFLLLGGTTGYKAPE